jgi:hypothetical protein
MIDLRFDPFRFEFRPKTITGETKTVQHFPAFNRVGFFLNETPQRVTSYPIVIVCAGDTLSEVSRVTSPAIDNFRVDYGNVNNFAQAGFVEVNSDRIGQVALVNYRGLGVNLNASLLDLPTPNIERSLITAQGATVGVGVTVEGVTTIQSSVDLAQNALAEIFFGGKRAQNVGTPIADGDLLTIQKALAMNVQGGVRVLTSGSGTVSFPQNTRYVFVAMVGGGGCGSPHYLGDPGAGGGGGGSPAFYGLIDLNVLGAGPYAYSIAPNTAASGSNPAPDGTHSTIFGCNSGYGGGGSYNRVTGVATGGVYTAGSLGSAVVVGRLVTEDLYGASVNGDTNSGTTSGKGGNAGAMLGNAPAAENGVGSNPFLSGYGGIAVAANFSGNTGSGFGAGGSGAGGDLGPGGALGGAARGGCIFLLY